MKYIDADKLIAEIDNIIEMAIERWDDEQVTGAEKLRDLLDAKITSLQQEQPDDTPLVERAICWFDNIAENSKKLSSGNVSHLGPTITGMAIRSKEFLEKHRQEQPEGNLEYWLEHFGMPKENIDNCITQIAQGYGACRYLEGIQHGADAVNELAKQDQPEVDLLKAARYVYESWMGGTMDDVRRDMAELGKVLNARKEN